MKKILLLAASAVVALASCTQSDEIFNGPDLEAQAKADNAITFSTYLGGNDQTRAGYYGSITTQELKDLDASNNHADLTQGFGVFAYYTGNSTYSDKNYPTSSANAVPDFMYNEQVKYQATNSSTWEHGDVTHWEYAPVKFWPNDFANSDVDDGGGSTPAAQGSDTYGGNVSFFAYAPYVPVSQTTATDIDGATPTTSAKNQSDGVGITAVSGNNYAGDPYITYTMSTDGSKTVDLLWGTCNTKDKNVLGSGNAGVAYKSDGTDYQKAILPNWVKSDHSATDAADGYRLNADLNKQKTNGTIAFAFKHALAKVGGKTTSITGTGTTPNGLMVVLDIDKNGAETGGTKNDNTKVTIVDIQVESGQVAATVGSETTETKGNIVKTGRLNLATGQWTLLTRGGSSDKVTHNITSDASTLTSSAVLAEDIAEPAHSGSNWDGTNKVFTVWPFTSSFEGVTTTPKNVYKTETNPFLFFPGTKPVFTVTVTYIVRTQDGKLARGWSEVYQKIKKEVTFANAVELNKQYSLVMHLGLTGVKFTAEVSNWVVDGDTDGDGVIESGEDVKLTEVDLPINVQ